MIFTGTGTEQYGVTLCCEVGTATKTKTSGKVNPVNKCLKKSDVSAERCKYRSSAVNRHNAITSKTTIQTNEEEDIHTLDKIKNIVIIYTNKLRYKTARLHTILTDIL